MRDGRDRNTTGQIAVGLGPHSSFISHPALSPIHDSLLSLIFHHSPLIIPIANP